LLVVGVYGYSYSTDFGASIQESEPVGYIACPNSYMSISFDADGKQSFCHIINTLIELPPGKTQVTI
jgi:hypothetical protein